MADAKINITASDAVCADGRYGAVCWVAPRDVKKAAQALGAASHVDLLQLVYGFNLLAAKRAMNRLSGDQNGYDAPSVPANRLELVDQTGVSWNHFTNWLRRLGALRGVA